MPSLPRTPATWWVCRTTASERSASAARTGTRAGTSRGPSTPSATTSGPCPWRSCRDSRAPLIERSQPRWSARGTVAARRFWPLPVGVVSVLVDQVQQLVQLQWLVQAGLHATARLGGGQGGGHGGDHQH